MVDGYDRGGPDHRRWWGWAVAALLILLLGGVGVLVSGALRADDRTLAAVGGPPPSTTTVPDPPPPSVPAPPSPPTTPAPSPTTTPVDGDTLGAEDRISLDGIGPVRVGMTLAEASAAAGQGISEVPGSGAGTDPAACFSAVPDTGQPKVSFLVVGGAIARVDVGEGSATRTISGIGVGAAEADVLATYGDRIVVEPHPSIEGGHHLRYVPDDPARSLIFETDGATVRRYRSGAADAVLAAKACA